MDAYEYELAGFVDCIYRHVIYVPRARRTESSIPVSVHVCVCGVILAANQTNGRDDDTHTMHATEELN
jgi:hypothetical protein